MNTYRVKRIDLDKVKTPEEYLETVRRAPIAYCIGLKELRKYCGGRLRQERNIIGDRIVYMGSNGNIEYVAERV